MTPSRAEVHDAQVQSDINYEALTKEFGNDVVLPVFHQGEGRERLHEVVAQIPNISASAHAMI